jgi:hypothetical protein
MSYSRWSSSTWYTFWTAMSEETEYKLPTKRRKYNQFFEICDFPSFYVSYGDIKTKGMDNIIDEIKVLYSKSYEGKIMKSSVDENGKLHPVYEPHTYPPKNPSSDELSELKGYLERFIKDVDEDFKFIKFMKYAWYYPTRNKIRWKIRDIKKNF